MAATTVEQIAEVLTRITNLMLTGEDAPTVPDLVGTAARDLLGAAAAAVLLLDDTGAPRVAAATEDRAALVEMLQTTIGAGPCIEAIHTGRPVSVANGELMRNRWPEFGAAATGQGYHAMHAVPLLHAHTPIGALGLLYTGAHPATATDTELVTGLANLITIALITEPTNRRHHRLAHQTAETINNRIWLAQATGIIAATLNLTPDLARQLLTTTAGTTGQTPITLAHQITNHTLHPNQLAHPDPDLASS